MTVEKVTHMVIKCDRCGDQFCDLAFDVFRWQTVAAGWSSEGDKDFCSGCVRIAACESRGGHKWIRYEGMDWKICTDCGRSEAAK